MISINERNGDVVVGMDFFYIDPTPEVLEKLGDDQRIERISGRQLLPAYLLDKCGDDEKAEAVQATVERLLAGVGPTIYETLAQRANAAEAAAADEEHEESLASIDDLDVNAVPDEVSMPDVVLGEE